MKPFQYIGLVLTESSKQDLLKLIPPLNGKLYLDHCTILHESRKSTTKGSLILKNLEDYFEENELLELKIIGIGYLPGRVIAFKVLPPIEVYNNNPHITIATFNNAKAVESNMITHWTYFTKPIKVITQLKYINYV